MSTHHVPHTHHINHSSRQTLEILDVDDCLAKRVLLFIVGADDDEAVLSICLDEVVIEVDAGLVEV